MYEYTGTVVRIVDGDTLDVMFDLGLGVFKKERVRLLRIDTPETYGVKKDSEEYQAGKLATEFVIKWVESNDNVIVVKTTKDKKGGRGRYLAEIYGKEGENLNDLLLEKGLAELY